jgi:hypothetical protein
LDEDEFVISKTDPKPKDAYNCKLCWWEESDISKHPCSKCSRNPNSGLIGRQHDAYVSRIGIWRNPKER